MWNLIKMGELAEWWQNDNDSHPKILARLKDNTREEMEEFKVHHGELEHQIGRYHNMKDIVEAIIAENITGDVVEFGSFRGLSLMMLAQCFRDTTTPRKFIGIDSFEGLPEASTVWQKGQFDNTSTDLIEETLGNNFSKNPALSYSIIKGWFNDPEIAISLYTKTPSVSLIHFDADLGSSTTMALNIISNYLIGRIEPMYFLFDDWGCHPDEVPKAWNEWLPTVKHKFGMTAQEISSTSYTKYFKITFSVSDIDLGHRVHL